LKTTLRSWTNSHLIADGKKEVSQTKFLAYIGLEMAMSIAQFNTVEEYWKRDMFLGHKDFQRVMSRDDFQNIRSHMKFVPPSMSNDGEVSPLYNIFSICNPFAWSTATPQTNNFSFFHFIFFDITFVHLIETCRRA